MILFFTFYLDLNNPIINIKKVSFKKYIYRDSQNYLFDSAVKEKTLTISLQDPQTIGILKGISPMAENIIAGDQLYITFSSFDNAFTQALSSAKIY